LGDTESIRQTINFFEKNGVKVEQSGVRL